MRVKRPPGCKRSTVSCVALSVLVAASLVDSAQAAYSCTSDSQCQYEGCNDQPCSSPSPCINGKWRSWCSNVRVCYWNVQNWQFCDAPPPCSAGQYSIGDGKNGGGDYTCRSCGAGKHASSAGSTACTSCTAGKYIADSGSTVCTSCDAGKYSAAVGVHLLAIHTQTPARTYAHNHTPANTKRTCMHVWMKLPQVTGIISDISE